MKIIYLGDNSCRLNYGCIATSLALHDLISNSNEIVGTITGEYTFDSGCYDLFFEPKLSKSMYHHLTMFKSGTFCYKVWRKFARLNGFGKPLSNYDFVRNNPEKSIDNLIKCISLNPQLKSFDLRQYDFDALVVNGEGTMIFTTPPRRDSLVYMMFILWAKRLNKKVYFLNSMFSDCSINGNNKNTLEVAQKIFPLCDIITVRDNYSLNFVKKHFNNCNVKFVPDALFSWLDKYENINFENVRDFLNKNNIKNSVDFSKPYIVISGNSLANTNHDKAYLTYKQLVLSLKRKTNIQICLLEACLGDSFLEKVATETSTTLIPIKIPIEYGYFILKNAKVYISGRYHPSIMASLGGTPCVFQGSNSHKTNSLKALLQYENSTIYNAFPTYEEIPKIIEETINYLDNNEIIRNKIKEIAKGYYIDMLYQYDNLL